MIAIYQILNKITNKCYIGSSNNVKKRWGEHRRMLRKNKHHSATLQLAWNLHGADNFEFIILKVTTKELKLVDEQSYLIEYTPSYNISISATAPMEGRSHSVETIQKFKSRKVKRGAEHYRTGKPWSKEDRETILAARKNSNYKHSDETKAKMRATSLRLNRGKDLEKSQEQSKKKIIDSLGNIFSSITETAKFHGISPATVCDILKGRHFQTRKKVSFKYA